MWQWRSSAFSKDGKTKTAVAHLCGDNPLSGDPRKEHIDLQIVIQWPEDRSEEEQILAALYELQTLIGKEIMVRSANPDVPV